jgi:ATP-dependent Clp protease protease subunit
MCQSAMSAEIATVLLTKDNTISLNDAFYDISTSNVIKKANELDARVKSDDPIYLVINSPGGSIESGLELIENLSNIKRPIKTISLFSASMGFQTVQGLGERLIVKNGTLMAHKAKGGFYGEFPGQLDTRYNYYLKRVLRMDEIAVSRTAGKYTLKSFRALIEPEYWCDGQDCIDNGFADKIVKPSCDKSLEGTTTVSVFQEAIQGHTVELLADYDACPLNTQPLKYKILIDGTPMFVDSQKEEKKQLLYFTNLSLTDPTDKKLSKEDLFEINKRVQRYIDIKKNREVIKGY